MQQLVQPITYELRQNAEMDQEPQPSKRRHLKTMLVGGGIFGAIGAGFGYAAGLTGEGAAVGFVLGWVIGEIVGLGTLQ